MFASIPLHPCEDATFKFRLWRFCEASGGGFHLHILQLSGDPFVVAGARQRDGDKGWLNTPAGEVVKLIDWNIALQRNVPRFGGPLPGAYFLQVGSAGIQTAQGNPQNRHRSPDNYTISGRLAPRARERSAQGTVGAAGGLQHPKRRMWRVCSCRTAGRNREHTQSYYPKQPRAILTIIRASSPPDEKVRPEMCPSALMSPIISHLTNYRREYLQKSLPWAVLRGAS